MQEPLLAKTQMSSKFPSLLKFIPVRFTDTNAKASLSLETCCNIDKCQDVADLKEVILTDSTTFTIRPSLEFHVTLNLLKCPTRAMLLEVIGEACQMRQRLRKDPNISKYQLVDIVYDEDLHTFTPIIEPPLA